MGPEDIAIKLRSMDAPLFKKMTEWVVWSLVKKYSQKTLNRDVRPHEIRHAYATRLEDEGTPIRYIQKYLGHNSVATTEIYLHSDEKKGLSKIKQISKDL